MNGDTQIVWWNRQSLLGKTSVRSSDTVHRDAMTYLRTVGEAEVAETTVLCRMDLDVDYMDDGSMEPGGDYRIAAGCQTIQYLRREGAVTLIAGHIGRPGGKPSEELRTSRIVSLLSHHLGEEVISVGEIAGPRVQKHARKAKAGDILLLENVRFDPREEENDIEFARELAAAADVYVNESFATAHRSHASVGSITTLLPSYAGFRFAREVETLERVLKSADRPKAAIVSGAKMGTKIRLLRNLMPRVDVLFTGGGIANMFLAAAGYDVGGSIMEPEVAGEVEELWESYKDKIRIPSDVVVARGGKDGVVVALDDIRDDEAVYDIGPDTSEAYCTELSLMRTVVWNGPLGKVEHESYREGTGKVASCLAGAEAFTVAGGGDTISILTQLGVLEKFDHVSTGGGAMVAFLEGKPLPAVEALRSSL